jgi:hypothetical protein
VEPELEPVRLPLSKSADARQDDRNRDDGEDPEGGRGAVERTVGVVDREADRMVVAHLLGSSLVGG